MSLSASCIATYYKYCVFFVMVTSIFREFQLLSRGLLRGTIFISFVGINLFVFLVSILNVM